MKRYFKLTEGGNLRVLGEVIEDLITRLNDVDMAVTGKNIRNDFRAHPNAIKILSKTKEIKKKLKELQELDLDEVELWFRNN